MPLDFNLQRAEQCLFVHLKTSDDFSLVGETGKGHDKLLRNARQEASTKFQSATALRSICTQAGS
jgi:ribose 1,5-bisphosphokinase PhnN